MKTLVYCVLGLGLPLLGRAQVTRADSAQATPALAVLAGRYAQALGTDSRLYNGPEYVSYVRRDTQGHRFFGDDTVRPATVTYFGHAYPQVPLRYDLVRQQLVLRAPGGGLEMRLLNEQVAGFELDGHRFVRLGANAPAGPGYYDLLVDAPTLRLLARHRKDLQERSTASGVLSEISSLDDYYVEQAGRYQPVSKAGSVLKLLPAQKTTLRRYIRERALNFKPATREAALTALLRYAATQPPPPAP